MLPPRLGGSGQFLVGSLKGALLRGTGMFLCGDEQRSLGRQVSRIVQELDSPAMGHLYRPEERNCQLEFHISENVLRTSGEMKTFSDEK